MKLGAVFFLCLGVLLVDLRVHFVERAEPLAASAKAAWARQRQRFFPAPVTYSRMCCHTACGARFGGSNADY